MTTTLDLSTLNLASGSHPDRSNGLCLLEAVAYFADETHGDHPACVSPLLASFGRRLNDILPNDMRQELKPLIPLLVDTVDPARDLRDACRCADWAARVIAPEALAAAGLETQVERLRALSPVVDRETAGGAAGAARGKLYRDAIDFYATLVRERATT